LQVNTKLLNLNHNFVCILKLKLWKGIKVATLSFFWEEE